MFALVFGILNAVVLLSNVVDGNKAVLFLRSGAGKTEMAKILMNHLAFISQQVPAAHRAERLALSEAG